MQIVINVDNKLYEYFSKRRTMHDDGYFSHVGKLIKAFRDGTILPKGHGRLGDLDALEKLCTEYDIANSAYDNSPMIEQGHYSDGDCIWKPLFDFALTIIEADVPKRRKGTPLEENDSGYNCENWIP